MRKPWYDWQFKPFELSPLSSTRQSCRHFTSKLWTFFQALLAPWPRSALNERVQRRTSQRSVPYMGGHPIKITMLISVYLQQCASLVLVRPSERAFGVFHSPRSLFSQEVCLTVDVGTMRTTRQIWKCRPNTPGSIFWNIFSLTHMRSINHLYNACHIKCYYDCGLESVSAVLKLAWFQDSHTALGSPQPPSIYLWGPYMPAGACLNASLRVAAVLSHGPHLHWLGRRQGQIRRNFTATFLKPSVS